MFEHADLGTDFVVPAYLQGAKHCAFSLFGAEVWHSGTMHSNASTKFTTQRRIDHARVFTSYMTIPNVTNLCDGRWGPVVSANAVHSISSGD